MSKGYKPLPVVMYRDVLCAWCFIADQRLQILRKEFGDALKWESRAYPLRPSEQVPSSREIAEWVQEVDRARKEPEGANLVADLWTSGDPPRSSLPALAALEAARLQGASARDKLAIALQRAALEQGVNVNRVDVVFELASGLGLNMNRFAAVYESPETRRWILEEHRMAENRGIKGVPTLVVGGRWMISGLKEVAEYRESFLKCIEKAGAKDSDPERMLH